MQGLQDFSRLGEIALIAIGILVFIGLNFACYYFPTKMVMAKAGQPPMAFRYFLQGFLAMLLAGVLLAATMNFGLSLLRG